MNPFDLLFKFFVLTILFCGLMPLLGGWLLHLGLRRYQTIDVPLSKCMTIFWCAAGVAYLLMMLVTRLLPDVGGVSGVVLACFFVALFELAVIGVMLRRFTINVLLVETSAVVATNLVGYGLLFFSAIA